MAYQNEVAPNTATTTPENPNGRHQLRMAHLEDRDIPREVVQDIFKKAEDSSLVLRTGSQVPVGYGETIIRVDGVNPEVGQVGVGTRPQDREGYEKPVSGVSWGSKSFAPIKLATIVTASMEFERTDPQRFAQQLQSKMSAAIGRGIDLAVFHGKRPDTGEALQGIDLNGFINKTTKRQALGESIYDDIMTGYTALAEDEKELSLFAADQRLRPKLVTARDAQGNQLFQSALNLNDPFDTVAGVRVEYGRAVSGRIGAGADSGTRLIAGDFSQLVYGYADQITFKRTDVGNIGDVNLWQTNQVAYLVEVTFGWLVNDLDSFYAYDVAADDGGGTV